MMKSISVIILYIFIFGCSTENDKNIKTGSKFEIKFTTISADSINYPGNGVTADPTKRVMWEKIKSYPETLKVIDTYFFAPQRGQYYYNSYFGNENERQRVDFIDQNWIEKSKDIYIKQKVDCIVSLCIVENRLGETFAIFDQNNDENFSNDPILNFQEIKLNRFGNIIEIESVESKVQIEYFDGNKINNQSILVCFRKSSANTDPSNFSLREIKLGKIEIDNTLYTSAILSVTEEIEYLEGLIFWIDRNQNRKFDVDDDFIVFPHKPFTFKGKVYKIDQIDRFGDFIIIEELESEDIPPIEESEDIPPIEKGKPAPDFTAATIDSNQFQLSKMSGRYILLDFWGTWCGPCKREIPYLKNAYNKFKSANFEIVSIGVDDVERLKKYIEENDMDWIHIQQNKDSEIIKIYQVAGFPSAFLIDRMGNIVAMPNELRGENLDKTLQKYIH